MPGENGKEDDMGFQKFVEDIVDLLQERMGDAYEIRVLHVIVFGHMEHPDLIAVPHSLLQ